MLRIGRAVKLLWFRQTDRTHIILPAHDTKYVALVTKWVGLTVWLLCLSFTRCCHVSATVSCAQLVDEPHYRYRYRYRTGLSVAVCIESLTLHWHKTAIRRFPGNYGLRKSCLYQRIEKCRLCDEDSIRFFLIAGEDVNLLRQVLLSNQT